MNESWSRSGGRKKQGDSLLLIKRLTHSDAAVLWLTVCLSVAAACSQRANTQQSSVRVPSVALGYVQGQNHDQPFLPLSLFALYTRHTGNAGWEKAFFDCGLIGGLVGEIEHNSEMTNLQFCICSLSTIITEGRYMMATTSDNQHALISQHSATWPDMI